MGRRWRRGKWALVVLWLVVVAVAGSPAGKLQSVQSDQAVNYLPKAAQSTQVEKLLARFPTGKTVAAVVVYARPGGLSGGDRAQIATERVEVASRVSTAGPVGPLVAAKDGSAALFAAPLTQGDPKVLGHQVTQIRGLVGTQPSGLQVGVTGPAAFAVDANNAFQGIDSTLLLAAGAVVAVLLLLIYRSPFLWLVPLITAGVALVAAQAAVYALARYASLTVTGLSTGILDVLVFGAGTDYALLIIARYREELRRHEDRHQAMALALRRAAPAIVASASTVVLGLLCLLVASLNSDRGLGPVAAIGIVAALAAALTALPALLLVCGRWVFWPFVPHPGTAEASLAGPWSRIGAWVGRRPRPIWVGTVVLLALGSAGLAGLHLGLPQSKGFTNSIGALKGQGLLDAHFPVGTGAPTIVIASSSQAPRVAQLVPSTPGVAAVYPSGQAGDLTQLSVTLAAQPDSPAAYTTVRQLRSRLASVPAGGSVPAGRLCSAGASTACAKCPCGGPVLVGGSTAINLDVDSAATHDRDVVIPLVLAVVLVVLGLLLRALVAPLVLVATVILSFAAALGVSGLVFDWGFGFAGVDQSVPLFAFIFLVALGVDYNIFLMSRIREEAARRGTWLGTQRALALTGGVITSAGVILAATFAVLALLPLVVLVEVGFTVAFGILLDTLVVRSILVPALTLELGDRIWWPSRMGRARRPLDTVAAPGDRVPQREMA